MKTDRQEEILARIALVQFIKHNEPRFRNCFMGGFTTEELYMLEKDIEKKLAKKQQKPPEK